MPASMTVIGGGPGGYQAAIRAAQLGASVKLVEAAHPGGVCLHWGCIPSKTLQASAHALETVRDLAKLGIKSQGGFEPDLSAIRVRKEEIIALQAQGIAKLLGSHGVEVVEGRGCLLGPGAVRVELNQGGVREIKSDKVILATGSKTVDLPGVPRDGNRVWNSNDALEMSEVPPRLAVVGGGVLGCELASIYSAFGSKVTIIEALGRLLPLSNLDSEVSKLLLREMEKRGITCHTAMAVESWQETGRCLKLNLGPSPLLEHLRPPKAKTLEVDKILVAVGRKPNTESLGLSQAGVELDEHGGVQTGSDLLTNLPGVYAIGDLLGPRRPMLAHMAGHEGVAAAAHAVGLKESVCYSVVPSVVFTSPEAAWAGFTSEQAASHGITVREGKFLFSGLGKAQARGEIAGQVKLVTDMDNGRLLGASIIGPQATELIHTCVVCLRLGASASHLAHTIFGHPTLSEAIHQAAEDALGLGIHSFPQR